MKSARARAPRLPIAAEWRECARSIPQSARAPALHRSNAPTGLPDCRDRRYPPLRSASSRWSNSYKCHFAAVGCRCAIRCRVRVAMPFGTTIASPSTTRRSCCARRHASSQRIPTVSAPSTVDCVSWSFTPTTARARCPWRSKPRKIGRTEGVFEIHAGGEPDDGPAGKISFERPAQARLVGDARRPSRRPESADRDRGRSRGASGDSAPCAAPATGAWWPSLPHRARAARNCARSTTDAAGICCTRRKSSTSIRPDRTRWRRLPPPPRRARR